MAVTISETEGVPAAYPDPPAGLSEAAAALDAAMLWKRIEDWTATRWPVRSVVYVVEGPGEWVPRLSPFSASVVEVWRDAAWAPADPTPSPLGGYVFDGEGPYRITGSAGDDTTPPAAMMGAFSRLAEYLAGDVSGYPQAGAASLQYNIGEVTTTVQRNPAWIARNGDERRGGLASPLSRTRRMRWPWSKKPKLETRAAAAGFTAEIIAARESYISGSRGLAELTAAVQSCVSLWENGFALADVEGAPMLTRRSMAMAGRAAALRGEAVFVIEDDRLIPASDWDLTTRGGEPKAYRLQISEAGGGVARTALAAEVLHLRIGADVVTPYYGQAPLRRANLTAELLHALESALRKVYECAPLGSQIVPFPEARSTDMERLGRGFRGQRGRVLLRESVTATAAGGPMPQADWRPSSVTPDLSKSLARETLEMARDSIAVAFGVLPGFFASSATGPAIREAQRHLAQWMLQPMAALLAEEATAKLGQPVTIDVMRPMQAFDAGGRARALAGVIQALSLAKDSGVDPDKALSLVDWAD